MTVAFNYALETAMTNFLNQAGMAMANSVQAYRDRTTAISSLNFTVDRLIRTIEETDVIDRIKNSRT